MLTKLGTYLILKRIWNLLIFKIIGQKSRSPGQICYCIVSLWTLWNQHPSIDFAKLGTYLVLKSIWTPIDFLGQRSRSPGQILDEGICHALRCPCFKFEW